MAPDPTPTRIGVVLVNWNTATLTADCVRSLLDGTRRPDRILVVDNGSTAADRAILDGIPGIDRLDLPENTGFTGANNRGIESLLADGCDLVWILNNDTLVDVTCLASLAAHLDANPHTGAVSGKILYADPATRLWYAGGILPASLSARHRGVLEDDRGQYDTPGPTPFLCGCCMLVRAEVLRRVGAFHPDFFAYFEDTEWSLRARAAGVRMDYVPAARLRHRIGSTLIRAEGRDRVGGRSEALIFRNWIFTIRLHARGWRAAYARAAVARHAARRIFAAQMRGQPDGARAIRRAIRDGWTTPLHGDPARTPVILVVGQTPPPWGGQARMIGAMIDGVYEGFRLHLVRMNFSEQMNEISRFRWRKVTRLAGLTARTILARIRTGARVLYYPPGGAHRVPLWRDLVFLNCTRWMFRRTVFHFHAGGVSSMLESLPAPARVLYRRAYHHADLAIRISRLTPDDGRLLHARREVIAANGIEDECIAPPDRRGRPGPVRILYLGALTEMKGVGVLLESCVALAREGVPFHLTLVGEFLDAPFRAAALPRIEDPALAPRITLAGFLNGEAKAAAYRDADLFVFPSFSMPAETFGLVAVEAMSFALPVIATNWSGIPDVVADGVTGRLVPPRDPVALAAAIRELIDDPALRERWGQAGRRRFLDEFTLDAYRARLATCLREVAREELESRR